MISKLHCYYNVRPTNFKRILLGCWYSACQKVVCGVVVSCDILASGAHIYSNYIVRIVFRRKCDVGRVYDCIFNVDHFTNFPLYALICRASAVLRDIRGEANGKRLTIGKRVMHIKLLNRIIEES